ncbi:MAG TPA: two-component regulator propeller domain-containing protein [Chitinophagaceae bacterium]|nr:two-component regulator propeller domain-containing protein [Chitinophagaceae bacterium]
MNLSKLLQVCAILLILIYPTIQYAQQVPIGQWQTHSSFNSSASVEKVNDKIFAAKTNLYSYSITEKDYTHYSKVNGLSDVNIQFIQYDPSTNNLLIVYENGNIDLMQENTFSNLPDIKNSNFTGSKRINSVFFKNKYMYLCTDFGIVVLDPTRKEIKESYVLQQASEVLKIKALTTYQGNFYAATANGIYKASESNPALQNFSNWTAITSSPTQYIFNHQNQLYCANETFLYAINSDTLSFEYEAKAPITNITQGINDIYLTERNENRRVIMILNQDGLPIDSVFNTNSNDLVEYSPTEIWDADEWEGLIQLSNRKDKNKFNPNGVYSNSYYKLSVFNDDIYVCAGAESGWIASFNSGGISKYSNGSWDYFNRYVGTPSMDSVIDIVDLIVDKKTKYIYAASYGGGLLEIHPDKTTTVFKNNGFIQSQLGNPGANIIFGLAFDEKNNLWMSNYSAPEQMVVKKADGSWQKFGFPYSQGEKSAGQIVIDNASQKWMIAPRGIGVYVLNDNNTIDNKNDDEIRLLTAGAGSGNLPNNQISSILKDKNGKIWIGTSDGIGIINCPENIMDQSSCDGELKIVKYDLNAGLLFQRESINAMAVDGANNKWIGTNNGIWLISDDAERIIHQFNKDNSPLPSNEVKSIVVQPNSGEVFIATNAGLVSYRSEATDGKLDNSSMVIFPNPVPSNYQGMIAMKDLVENADVRITDVAGQLVYRTKAQGGQATWNGKNYLGERPRTGVYYVFVTNADGSESKVGKFIYNE